MLANSNPATIMTDPEWADATYLEPLDAPTLAEIIGRERPDALLPTLGGQTALNLAVELAENGVLAEHGVELIGADLAAIRTAEDRSLFRAAMEAAGLAVPESVVVTSLEQLADRPVPAVVRPAFTLGGRGGGLARNRDELRATVSRGSPRAQSARSWSSARRRLAGVRARGRGRHRRKLHRRLLDREPRSGRRPHRRLVTVAPQQTSPTASCSGSATPPSPVPAPSASPPAAPTSSSPTSRRRASCS